MPKWETQSREGDIEVKVRTDYDRKGMEKGEPRTDFLIIDHSKSGPDAHTHVSVDEDGNYINWDEE